jgi:hypothetical protein
VKPNWRALGLAKLIYKEMVSKGITPSPEEVATILKSTTVYGRERAVEEAEGLALL